MRCARAFVLLSGLLLLSLVTACGSGAPPVVRMKMPEFQLQDVNPASATYQQKVSPSYFKGQISAWYFGHAT